MSSVVLPRPIREAALDTIAERLGYRPSLETPLAGLGDPISVQLMLALEQRFGILIDVDEVLPHGSVETLVGLTVLRSCSRPMPTEPFTLIDLAAARAERARRARNRAGILPSLTAAEAAALARPTPAVEPPPPAPAEPSPAPVAAATALIPLLVSLYRHDRYARLLMNLGAAFCGGGFLVGLLFWSDAVSRAG